LYSVKKSFSHFIRVHCLGNYKHQKDHTSRRVRPSRRLLTIPDYTVPLIPDHNTISNFRKDNPRAIKNVFRATVGVASHFELIGGKLVAGDSTKLRAQNSKKNNFTEKKIELHLEYIDNKLAEYDKALAATDKQEDKVKALSEANALKENIHTQKKRKAEYQRMQNMTKATIPDPNLRQQPIWE